MTGFLANEDLTPNAIELARQRRAAAGGYIDLTSSNPTHQGLLFPAEILHAAADQYWQHRHYTPDARGAAPARAAIAGYYARRTPALPITPADILITASTSEAYSLLFTLLTDPGDNLLAPAVTYPLFEYLAAMHRIELRPYALDERRDWRIDPASLRAQADARTRGVLVVSPHNPTGMVVQAPVPALDSLVLPVICDEVFAEFPYRISHVPPLGALHPQLPIFHLNGISKMFALPDLKLGWIALSAAARTQYGERLELLNDTFLSAGALPQAMLPAIIEHGGAFVGMMRDRVYSSITLACEVLRACPALSVTEPDGGYYLFPEIHGWDDEEALVLYLLEQGVLVHPGFFFNYELGTRIMISCLTEPAQLRAGCERIVVALS